MLAYSKQKAHLIVLSAVILLFCAITALRMMAAFLPYVDDAFIFLRYARNIAAGFGATWNPGEPPVEGFTSFLFQMMLSITELLGWKDASRSGWLGIFFSACAILIFWRLASRIIGSSRWVPVIVAGALSFSPVFLNWTVSGLDSPLFTCLLLASVLSYFFFLDRKAPASAVGLLFSLTALVRPEGAILFLLTAIIELIRKLLLREKLSDLWMMGLVFSIILMPVYAGRWLYFGFPFPNSYYVKTGAGAAQWLGGIAYVKESLVYLFHRHLIFMIAVVGCVGLVTGKSFRFETCYLGGISVVLLGIVAFNGGDHFGGARFLEPVLPLLLIIISVGISDILSGSAVPIPVKAGGVLAVLLLMMYWCGQTRGIIIDSIYHFTTRHANPIFRADPKEYHTYDAAVIGFMEMGRTLKRIAQPGQSIAAIPVGAIGYYSGLRVFDMAGVVDVVIAHEPFDPVFTATWRPGHDKGDGLYILSHHPDFIQLLDVLTSQSMAEPDAHAMQYKSIVEIWNSEEFHDSYEFYPVQVEGGWYYNLYRRKI